MKIEDISKIMENVDERYVREALNYKPKNRNATKLIALAACIAIIVTAIPVTLILNREKDVDAPKVTTPVEDIVVTPGGDKIEDNKNVNIIYCSSDLLNNEELIKYAFQNQDVVIEKASSYRRFSPSFYTAGEVVEPDVTVPEKLNFTISGINVTATLDTVYFPQKIERVTDETLKAYSKIARYSIETVNGEAKNNLHKDYKVYYNVASNSIIDLTFSQADVPSYTEEKLSEEELFNIVKKDIVDLYGEDSISQYRFTIKSEYTEPVISYGGWRYLVHSTRKVGDFDAFETITFYYNGSGQLSRMTSHNLNFFDIVDSKLTENVLSEVEETAIKLLNGNLLFKKRLDIGVDGNVYAAYEYYKDNYPYEFIIKINV